MTYVPQKYKLGTSRQPKTLIIFCNSQQMVCRLLYRRISCHQTGPSLASVRCIYKTGWHLPGEDKASLSKMDFV